MQIKGIKQGKALELSEEINLPDGTELLIEIQAIQSVPKDSEPGFWQTLASFRQTLNLEASAIAPEAVFEGVRDCSLGREVAG